MERLRHLHDLRRAPAASCELGSAGDLRHARGGADPDGVDGHVERHPDEPRLPVAPLLGRHVRRHPVCDPELLPRRERRRRLDTAGRRHGDERERLRLGDLGADRAGGRSTSAAAAPAASSTPATASASSLHATGAGHPGHHHAGSPDQLTRRRLQVRLGAPPRRDGDADELPLVRARREPEPVVRARRLRHERRGHSHDPRDEGAVRDGRRGPACGLDHDAAPVRRDPRTGQVSPRSPQRPAGRQRVRLLRRRAGRFGVVERERLGHADADLGRPERLQPAVVVPRRARDVDSARPTGPARQRVAAGDQRLDRRRPDAHRLDGNVDEQPHELHAPVAPLPGHRVQPGRWSHELDLSPHVRGRGALARDHRDRDERQRLRPVDVGRHRGGDDARRDRTPRRRSRRSRSTRTRSAR